MSYRGKIVAATFIFWSKFSLTKLFLAQPETNKARTFQKELRDLIGNANEQDIEMYVFGKRFYMNDISVIDPLGSRIAIAQKKIAEYRRGINDVIDGLQVIFDHAENREDIKRIKCDTSDVLLKVYGYMQKITGVVDQIKT